MIDIKIQHGNLGREYVKIGLIEFNQYKKRLENKEVKECEWNHQTKYYGHIMDNGILFEVVLTHAKGFNKRMTVSSWALVYDVMTKEKMQYLENK